jgi:hypothetical protein
MKYGIVKDGTVINVIEADKSFADKIGAIELPVEIGIGDTYADKKFTKRAIEKKQAIPKFSEMIAEEKDNLLYTLAKLAGIVE